MNTDQTLDEKIAEMVSLGARWGAVLYDVKRLGTLCARRQVQAIEAELEPGSNAVITSPTDRDYQQLRTMIGRLSGRIPDDEIDTFRIAYFAEVRRLGMAFETCRICGTQTPCGVAVCTACSDSSNAGGWVQDPRADWDSFSGSEDS